VPRLLEPAELARQLDDLSGWTGDPSAITCTLRAPDFLTGIRIVDEVAAIAEEMDHHPDIDIRWRTLVLTLSTHSAGGVTQLDVELAHRIAAVAAAAGAEQVT
jgi:4a-hydroxytetrahydrobiopterin dehydratase